MTIAITALVERMPSDPKKFIGWVHVETSNGKGFAKCSDAHDNPWIAVVETLGILRTIRQTVELFEDPIINDHTDELPS